MNKKILMIFFVAIGVPLSALNFWMMRESKENPMNVTTASPTSTPIPTTMNRATEAPANNVEYSAPATQKTYKCSYQNCGTVEYTDPSACSRFVCCEVGGRWSVMSTFECQTSQNSFNATGAQNIEDNNNQMNELREKQTCAEAVIQSQKCVSDCYENAEAAGSANPNCDYVCSFSIDMQNSLCK